MMSLRPATGQLDVFIEGHSGSVSVPNGSKRKADTALAFCGDKQLLDNVLCGAASIDIERTNCNQSRFGLNLPSSFIRSPQLYSHCLCVYGWFTHSLSGKHLSSAVQNLQR